MMMVEFEKINWFMNYRRSIIALKELKEKRIKQCFRFPTFLLYGLVFRPELVFNDRMGDEI